jgi:hypothetical protein
LRKQWQSKPFCHGSASPTFTQPSSFAGTCVRAAARIARITTGAEKMPAAAMATGHCGTELIIQINDLGRAIGSGTRIASMSGRQGADKQCIPKAR